MMVRVLDVKTLSWAVLTPSGDAPPARGSHSVSSKSCVNSRAICELCADHEGLQDPQVCSMACSVSVQGKTVVACQQL